MTALIIVGLVFPSAFFAAMYSIVSKRKTDMRKSLSILEDELKQRSDIRTQIKGYYEQMVSVVDIYDQYQEVKGIQDALKAERGRLTITQTELETVEGRLCELEEIERELEASNTETKEEMKILAKKEADLKAKNEALKNQIAASVSQMGQVLTELTLTTAQQEHVDRMKSELVRTEEKIESLVVELKQMNDQYVTLKMRYDALDIEYAQLYEKFSDAEAMIQAQEQQSA